MVINLLINDTGKGGETMLCDGFYCAEKLRQTNPEWYQLLSTTITSWRDIGQDYIKFDKITQKPFLM